MQDIHSPTPHIRAFLDGSTGWLVLDRPGRRNALNAAMWSAIPGLMESLAGRRAVRAIVIRGEGPEAFAAGADISEFGEARGNANSARSYEALNGTALAAIRNCPKPVIALIEGYCIGGGLAIALACDFRVSSPTGIFALPPARLGLAYPVDGLRDLLSAVSASVAKEMIFTARRFDAERALAVGLIDALAGDPAAAVRQLSAEIGEGAPLTILHAKRAIDMIAGKPGHVDEAELMALAARCFDSADYAEGRAAFAGKRKPRFTGN